MTATMPIDTGPPSNPSSRMLQMLNGFLTVQALYVAAALGIADGLADGSRSIDDLANATGADRVSLYRLLRMLSGSGASREEADGRFALTPLGVCPPRGGAGPLRSSAPYR